jgi:hypothetical protein
MNESTQRLSMTGRGRTSASIVDGDGFDGFRSGQNHLYDDMPTSGRDSDTREYYDSLHRVANNQHPRNNYPIELDSGSDGQFIDYALSPPKVSDSISLSRRAASPTRLSRSTFDPYGSTTSSINRPRTSPSKVGSKMWGSETPLSRKGNVPRVEENKWCCAVCLYVENPSSADHCLVCDSPNYNNMKVCVCINSC